MKTNLDKNKKYILACSYGPDSMALFSYLIKEKIYFEIAHVNYHILKQANDDEIGIRNEAKKYNIKVHVLETNMPKGVNEEDRAREIRYEYFKEVAIKTNIKDVLVAHNEDDLIETYLLQKERNNIVSYFGLKEVLNRNEYNVIRPLLGYTKKELLDYCKINQIPYSIDPSNSDVKFKRNKYRKEVINNLTKDDRINLLREIDKKNKEIAAFLLNTRNYYKNSKLNIDEKFKEEIPRYMIKHQVRPGITGWAQVNGYRGDTSITKRIEHDLYYIENWSIGFDIKILFLTVFKGFINKNAY